MNAHSSATVEAYWTGLLGCGVEDLRRPGVSVGTYRGPYRDAWWLRHGRSHVVSVPLDLVGRVRRVIDHRAPDAFDRPSIEGVLGSEARRIIGPCFLGYADQESLRGAHHPNARPLGHDDTVPLRRLRESCAAEEWAESGVEIERPGLFGCFEEQRLVAVASYEVWGGTLAHIGVITDPQRRGSGYGRAAAASAANDALDRGLVIQWRALESNSASVALGTSLGCTRWGSHFTALLTEPQRADLENL